MLNIKGKALYLPPKFLEDLRDGKTLLLIGIEARIDVLGASGIKVFHKNPGGILITPPGLALAKLFEDTLKVRFVNTSLEKLQKPYRDS
jgi:hypothetical protein